MPATLTRSQRPPNHDHGNVVPSHFNIGRDIPPVQSGSGYVRAEIGVERPPDVIRRAMIEG